MNLLLLLSALLSALTGVGGSVRAPDVAQAVAGTSVAKVAPVPVQVRGAHRPTQALPALWGRVERRATVVAVGPSMPLWTLRRRE